MQEKGLDTVDANRQLGLPDDAREYTSVRNILADLNVKSVKLMVSLSNLLALEHLWVYTFRKRVWHLSDNDWLLFRLPKNLKFS